MKHKNDIKVKTNMYREIDNIFVVMVDWLNLTKQFYN